MKWGDLVFWQSGEWQVVEERLDELDKRKIKYNPNRNLIFAALDSVPFSNVRVMVVGQDPYPDREHATGIAFSVPKSIEILPPTLVNFNKEIYDDYHDTGDPSNRSGDLSYLCDQGVLLWNVYPTCLVGKPGSHHWVEWEELTKEIVESLDTKSSVVFCFLGQKARHFSQFVKNSSCLETSHPSPLGVKHGFKGSRIFSSINGCSELKGEPIQWRKL